MPSRTKIAAQGGTTGLIRNTIFADRIGGNAHMFRPREIPPPETAELDMGELTAFLASEGWSSSMVGDDIVVVDGVTYVLTQVYIEARQYGDLPGPLGADILAGLAEQGL